jgi:caffeoyl-CoA O-methyltransferase
MADLPKILLDMKVIIDGRLLDICHTGFLPGVLLVPDFVVKQIEELAHDPDPQRRGRGHFGLELLQKLENEPKTRLEIIRTQNDPITPVSAKLIHIAKRLPARLLTIDDTLAYRAKSEGVQALNIKDLVDAVRPVLLPREKISMVFYQDDSLGIGYLSDGTMVTYRKGKTKLTTPQEIDQYISNLFVHEDDVLKWIQAEAQRNELPAISVQPFEGRLLQMLALSVGAKKIVEIGTLAGYSGVWLARALPADGKMYTLEKSSKHAKVARASFERAGVSDKVELLEGSAQDLFKKINDKGPFDFVFIDADKDSYPQYLDWAVENLRPGGMVAAHNALRDGRVLDPQEDTDRAMAAFNELLARDHRLESMIIAVGDGTAVGIKKG